MPPEPLPAWLAGEEPLPPSPSGLGYIFERFPSFTQTFCYREVNALLAQGLRFPVISIRRPENEPPQNVPPDVWPVTRYLPEDTVWLARRRKAAFRTASRSAADALKRYRKTGQHRRMYEALWAGHWLRNAGVRHVHAHFAGIAARNALWLKRFFGITYSITAHADDFFGDEGEPPVSLPDILKNASAIVAVSDYGAANLRDRFPDFADKVVRVYNGIPLPTVPSPSPPRTRKRIVSIGRYIEKKGFPDLIEACARLKTPDFECLIIGQGPMQNELQALIDARGLGQRVTLTGPKSEAEIASTLAETDLFVLPCIVGKTGSRDNLPTVIMEAMAAAVPVVSTTVAGVPEMVEHGETGFLVPEQRPDELASAMDTLLGDHDLAARFARQGRSLAEKRFAVEVTTGQLRQVWRERCGLNL